MGRVHRAKACPFAHRTRLVLEEKRTDLALTRRRIASRGVLERMEETRLP
jgi:hypothetical protein